MESLSSFGSMQKCGSDWSSICIRGCGKRYKSRAYRSCHMRVISNGQRCWLQGGVSHDGTLSNEPGNPTDHDFGYLINLLTWLPCSLICLMWASKGILSNSRNISKILHFARTDSRYTHCWLSEAQVECFTLHFRLDHRVIVVWGTS